PQDPTWLSAETNILRPLDRALRAAQGYCQFSGGRTARHPRGHGDACRTVAIPQGFRDRLTVLSAPVIALVLVGALLHASWNVAVRAAGDRRRETALVVGGGAIWAVLILPFLPI